MDRKLLRNYIYNILYQLVKIVLPLVTVPYLYAHVGAGTLGISDMAYNVAGWFILFGILGVNTYGNREIAKVRNDHNQLEKSFWEILSMQIFNMAIAMACYFLFVRFAIHQNTLIYWLTGLSMLASMLDITWFFYGVEDFKKASIRNIVVKIIGVALILLFIKTPDQLWLYVVFNCGSELIGQFIMFVQLKQYIGFQKISLKDAYKHHFKATFALFVPTIAISVYTLLDQTMIGTLYNETHLNYYKTSMSFIKMFLYFITSIGAVLLPRMTNVFYNEKDGAQKTQSLVNTTMKICLLLALPMCFGMMAISHGFVGWYLPNDPIIGDLIFLGCPIIIFISMSNVTGIQYMVPVGMYNRYSASVITGACVNFVINLILIPIYGAYGAIIASIIAELTVTLFQYFSIRKKVHIDFHQRSYWIYILGAILMAIAVWGVGVVLSSTWTSGAVIGNTNHYSLAAVLTTFIQILVGFVVYGLVLRVCKEELCMKVIGKIKGKRNAHA